MHNITPSNTTAHMMVLVEMLSRITALHHTTRHHTTLHMKNASEASYTAHRTLFIIYPQKSYYFLFLFFIVTFRCYYALCISHSRSHYYIWSLFFILTSYCFSLLFLNLISHFCFLSSLLTIIFFLLCQLLGDVGADESKVMQIFLRPVPPRPATLSLEDIDETTSAEQLAG